jgi:hypothetical protein
MSHTPSSSHENDDYEPSYEPDPVPCSPGSLAPSLFSPTSPAPLGPNVTAPSPASPAFSPSSPRLVATLERTSKTEEQDVRRGGIPSLRRRAGV